MPKIVFLGAGNTVFAKNLLGDILSFPALSESTIALHDIDPERLDTTRVVGERIAKSLGVHPTIETHSDRRAALDGADYAIGMFQVGGYEPCTQISKSPRNTAYARPLLTRLGLAGSCAGYGRSLSIWICVVIWKRFARMCSCLIM